MIAKPMRYSNPLCVFIYAYLSIGPHGIHFPIQRSSGGGLEIAADVSTELTAQETPMGVNLSEV